MSAPLLIPADAAPLAYGGGGLAIAVLIGILHLLIALRRNPTAPGIALLARGTSARVLAVERAARAQGDPALAPDRVRAATEDLLSAVTTARRERRRDELSRLAVPGIVAYWDELDDADPRLELQTGTTVRYVGLRRGDPDQVVVRLSARTYRSGGRGRRTTVGDFEEYWTLERQDDRWRIVRLEGLSNGKHNLTDPIIPAV